MTPDQRTELLVERIAVPMVEAAIDEIAACGEEATRPLWRLAAIQWAGWAVDALAPELEAGLAAQQRVADLTIAVRLYSGRTESWLLSADEKAAVARVLARLDSGEAQ